MSTVILSEPRIASVNVTDRAIVATLVDGRVISVPLHWSWRLSDATPEQRGRWEIIGEGQGVRWPEIDEDFSVDGLLRGEPARRPSKAELRVLLDASSLIDAEHGKPASFSDLDKTFRQHHARLILTYTSVLEFAEGFEKRGDRLDLRYVLNMIESLPVGYLAYGRAIRGELEEAVAAFSEGRPYAQIDPYVKRWDETLVVRGESPARALVNQSLDDLVTLTLQKGNVLREAREQWGPKLEQAYGKERGETLWSANETRERFASDLKGTLALHSVASPAGPIARFAAWVYEDPTRCPGYRLAHDWQRALTDNRTEKFQWNDVLDRSLVSFLPYVDALTMDRNTAHLCRAVAKRLKAQCPAINYAERIFTSLKQLLDAKF
jgi:Protein of unknown function (DUF2442)